MKFQKKHDSKNGEELLVIDYSKLGLKVGLEIHQQLDTEKKLFCHCTSAISTEEPQVTFYRRLRPTQSELGEVDPAAAFEYHKGRGFIYKGEDGTSCLVEMDEEPPHNLNDDAVSICLTVALMIGAKPVDEIHVMRKIVIDGSNTTGFQRTCVIALGGKILINGKKVSIQTVSLEEDAARKLGEKGRDSLYRLDRLCIPLIEIATAPEIYTPDDAGRTALALGRILRVTKKVKRGLGTIRQDLNISINGGALIEIKGVQDLSLMPKYVEYEVRRQYNLLQIRDDLLRRGVRKEELKEEFIDVTDVFLKTECKLIKKAIDEGRKIYSVTLPKFGKLMKIELEPDVRFATELSDYAKFWGRVGGIFYTNELPNYGLTEKEMLKLKQKLRAGSEDVVVFVAANQENAIDALKAVVERAKLAIEGVPSETRGANPDGTTHYARPRPGSARMYPETDVQPVPILKENVKKAKLNLPELPDVTVKRLVNEYNLNKKLAIQLQSSDYLPIFERIAGTTKISTSFVTAALTETLTNLRRKGVKVENVTDEKIERAFQLINEGKVAKEAFAEIFSWLAEHRDSDVEEAIRILGLQTLSENQLKVLIEKTIKEHMSLIKERGIKSVKPLMGILMSQIRGKANVKTVHNKLSQKVEVIIKKLKG